MNARVKDLFDEARKLPAEERAELLDLLLISAHTEPAPEAERAWNEEIERRLAAFDRGEVGARPWLEVQKELRARWK